MFNYDNQRLEVPNLFFYISTPLIILEFLRRFEIQNSTFIFEVLFQPVWVSVEVVRKSEQPSQVSVELLRIPTLEDNLQNRCHRWVEL